MLLNIIPIDLIEQYKKSFVKSIMKCFENLHDSELSIDTFSFYTSVSAVFSSKIEGEDIELDSFIKHKRFGTKYFPDYTRKIDDLYDAYLFAQQTKLSKQSLEKAHALLTKNILQKSQQGKLRAGNMFVITNDARIEYVAATPGKLKTEMKKLYDDIKTLLLAELSFEEVLFFASMLHLVFVKFILWRMEMAGCRGCWRNGLLHKSLVHSVRKKLLLTSSNLLQQHQAFRFGLRGIGLLQSASIFTNASRLSYCWK